MRFENTDSGCAVEFRFHPTSIMRSNGTKMDNAKGLDDQAIAAPNNALIGIAGVHHVVSELSRRGLVALPTIRNTAAYDVVVVTRDGTKHANIQVKTSSKKVGFFQMPPSDRIMAGRHDFYVLLRWDEKAKAYDGFMLTGQEARAEVAESEMRQRTSMDLGTRINIMPSLHIGGRAAKKAEKWRARWRKWRL